MRFKLWESLSKRKMPKTIFLPKWTQLLVALYNLPPEQCYCGRLNKATGMTIRHIRNLIDDLECMGMVRKASDGKIKYITLTETGSHLADQQIAPTYISLTGFLCSFGQIQQYRTYGFPQTKRTTGQHMTGCLAVSLPKRISL